MKMSRENEARSFAEESRRHVMCSNHRTRSRMCAACLAAAAGFSMPLKAAIDAMHARLFFKK